MKSYRKEFWFNIRKRREFINITPQVEKCLKESGVKEGLALVNAMHITASVFINDDEAGLHRDDLREILLKSSRHIDRFMEIIEEGHQGPDHPMHPAIPETGYLKAFFARLLPN